MHDGAHHEKNGQNHGMLGGTAAKQRQTRALCGHLIQVCQFLYRCAWAEDVSKLLQAFLRLYLSLSEQQLGLRSWPQQL